MKAVTLPSVSTKNPEEDIIPLPSSINTFGLPCTTDFYQLPKNPKLDTTFSDSNVSSTFTFEAVTLPSLSTKKPEDISPLH